MRNTKQRVHMAQDAPSSFEMQAASLVAEMTLEEKASLMSGTAFWHLQDIERLRLQGGGLGWAPWAATAA